MISKNLSYFFPINQDHSSILYSGFEIIQVDKNDALLIRALNVSGNEYKGHPGTCAGL
jgi:hypothetical protein